MEKKEEIKVSPIKQEFDAKIAKYEEEAKAYELTGRADIADAIRKEIAGLKQQRLMH